MSHTGAGESVYPHEIAVTIGCSRLCVKMRKMQWKDRYFQDIFKNDILKFPNCFWSLSQWCENLICVLQWVGPNFY